jgi:hypothetical protein
MLSKRNKSIFERKLLEKHISVEVRALNIGDMLWIARRERLENRKQFDMLDLYLERCMTRRA